MKYPVISWTRLAKQASATNEFLTIGPVPNEERCTPAGENYDAGLLECQIYADQLVRQHGALPEGCELVIIENHHEFGTYHEVGVCYKMYDEADEEHAGEYTASEIHASTLESGCEIWDDIARQQLIEAEHPLYVAKVIKMKKTA